VPRESGIETHFRTEVRGNGWVEKKEGQDGWPDRLIIWAPGRHFWTELKQPDGSLTAAQKQRIPWLRRLGETVFILDTRADITHLMGLLR
jgi:hypothetical protein